MWRCAVGSQLAGRTLLIQLLCVMVNGGMVGVLKPRLHYDLTYGLDQLWKVKNPGSCRQKFLICSF
jgi:hypothetical protein